MYIKNKEKNLLNLQLITSVVFVISILVSISLTYDEILKVDDKKLYDDDTAINIGVTNRIVVLILSLSFLYINYQNREIFAAKKKDMKFLNLQITASQLSVITAIIVLYVAIESGRYTITAFENPIL